MLSRTVHVALGERSYPIEIGTGNLRDSGRFLLGRRHVSHAVIITDSNVENRHAMTVAESLSDADMLVDLLVVDPGEASKCAEVLEGLWNKLLELGADRRTVITAVGGGVIGDLAGYVAASYARGLAFLQVPTTLLAQVDSSVGGKTGINLEGAKNMVGAFWQPIGVVVDTAVLDTLPIREYRSGLAEVVKYGVILDADFFMYLEENVAGLNARDPEVLREIVAKSCALKALVVSRDEREETGLRAVLNYGHTFCHAFETLTNYSTLLHGEAVSIGMMCAARLAERMGRIDQELVDRQYRLLTALNLPVDVPAVDHDAALKVMARDKKVEHGKLRFVLPTRMGHVELVGNVAPEDVLASML
ncbi:MAG: 3-dehydroquinate synthase [Planctomycetaceae bacterium]|nr:3-dehydroquinate synthase [Planctomycetaceae bacterium]